MGGTNKNIMSCVRKEAYYGFGEQSMGRKMYLFIRCMMQIATNMPKIAAKTPDITCRLSEVQARHSPMLVVF